MPNQLILDVRTALAASCLVLLAGCGDARQVTTGTVKAAGTPLPQIEVVFSPMDDSGEYATGLTDSAGRFQPRTGEEEGIKHGKYKVSFATTEAPFDEGVSLDEAVAAVQDWEQGRKPGLPMPTLPFHRDYLLPSTTPIEVTIPADKLEFTLEPPASGK